MALQLAVPYAAMAADSEQRAATRAALPVPDVSTVRLPLALLALAEVQRRLILAVRIVEMVL